MKHFLVAALVLALVGPAFAADTPSTDDHNTAAQNQQLLDQAEGNTQVLASSDETLPLFEGSFLNSLEERFQELRGTRAVCQPGTFQYNCKEIWGVSQGRCGANTWRYTFCKQYKDPYGKWYYQNCGSVQEVCSAPGGAECIPCL